MAAKRSYQLPTRYTKRQRTLGREVTKLKRQVAINKKELKYYDGFFLLPADATSLTNQSVFKDVTTESGVANNPIFYGRKLYVKKIQIRVGSLDSVIGDSLDDEFIMWREKRQGKDPTGFLSPLAFDPEYHTMLRAWEQGNDTDKRVKHFTVNFGAAGRLVEFDESGGTATGNIVTGDIKCSLNVKDTTNIARALISFRVWYCDG